MGKLCHEEIAKTNRIYGQDSLLIMNRYLLVILAFLLSPVWKAGAFVAFLRVFKTR
jgi:hypothetical protein